MGENSTIPVVILLGAPGAGKGTQAMRIEQTLEFPKISTGDMLRQAVDARTELGQKVQAIMEDGRLVDDETMIGLIRERIFQPDCARGFILDGYPRNAKQAKQLESILKPNMRLLIIDIKVSEEEVVKRISGRRSCPVCGRIYNMHFRAPENDEVCDRDGARLVRRSDDTEEVVLKRVATYKKETLPLIEYYQKMGVLYSVDGQQPETAVGRTILGCLKK